METTIFLKLDNYATSAIKVKLTFKIIENGKIIM